MNTFKRATRAQVPLKIGISGPSGAGKTTAALNVLRGLVGPDAPIALVDTENGSASLYADITTFDAMGMDAPYHVKKFIDAIDAAVANGYKGLIIDSASHEWVQILQDKEALDARGGNQWTNWASFTKQHELFLAKIRNAPIHLICCLRGKEKHEMDATSKKVTKLGVGSQMRDGFEFELTVSFDLDMKHNAITSKDRTRLFDGRLEQLTQQTGRELAAWLSSGGVLAPEEVASEPVDPTPSAKPVSASVAPSKQAAPTSAGEVFSQMAPPAAREIPQEVHDFVDGLEPLPKHEPAPPAPAFITTEQWEELTVWSTQRPNLPGQLRSYCELKGWLKPDAQGLNTLAASCWPALHNQITVRTVAFVAFLESKFPAAAPAAVPATESTTTRKPRARSAA